MALQNQKSSMIIEKKKQFLFRIFIFGAHILGDCIKCCVIQWWHACIQTLKKMPQSRRKPFWRKMQHFLTYVSHHKSHLQSRCNFGCSRNFYQEAKKFMNGNCSSAYFLAWTIFKLFYLVFWECIFFLCEKKSDSI